jgi:nucleotide-binding universal stress UspA family protein
MTMSNDATEQTFLPKHILVPVDFSQSCLHGLTAAMELAWRFNAKLSVIHVVEHLPPGTYLVMDAGDIEQEIESHAQKKLAEFVAKYVPDEMSVQQIVAIGKPFDKVVEKATELACELIVVSTHGYSGLAHVLMGSNAERIVQHAPCPVLVMRAHPGESSLPSATATAFRWVLLPTDFSENSSKACPLAAAIAREFDAPLTLAHVLPSMPIFLEHYNAATERADADAQLQKFRTEHCDGILKVTTTLLEGNPPQSLCKEAESDDPGLIVIATHGLTAWKHALLGSTAERVVQYAPCPVLVVR